MFDDLADRGWAQSHDHDASLLAPEWTGDLARKCQSLYDAGSFTPSAVGHGKTKSVQTQIRGDSTLWLEDLQEESLKNEISGFLQVLQQELNQALFLGLKRFESHFALYPAGSGYEKHIDNHQGLNHRRITFVLYLNENWQQTDGGELSLFSQTLPDNKIHSIQPVLGNLILFRSELFPHQVEASLQTRKSLTGWFRDDAL